MIQNVRDILQSRSSIMTELRLISFLPAATEMVFALGLGDQLVGVSYECDFPAAAKTKPVVVKPVLPLEKMSLCEIDAAVAERIGSGQDLDQVDEWLLEQLAPTHFSRTSFARSARRPATKSPARLRRCPSSRKSSGSRRTASGRFSAISANSARPPTV